MLQSRLERGENKRSAFLGGESSIPSSMSAQWLPGSEMRGSDPGRASLYRVARYLVSLLGFAHR